MKPAISILLIILIASFNVSCAPDASQNAGNMIIIPKVESTVVKSHETDVVRLVDLSDIPYALERYKIKYNMYPISSEQGDGWDGLYSQYGESRSDWIKGLVPEFLSQLPRDPRMNNSGSEQYLYKSDGANYKLIAHSPDDCQLVLKLFPSLVDPRRKCWAYGYWTPKSRMW